MNKGQKVLVIRYGANIVADCIERHMEVVDEYGFCWFGKIGTSPSAKVLDAVLTEEEPTIILYSKGVSYKASLIEVSKNKPVEAYPSYYNEHLYAKEIHPSTYFKIKDLRKMDVNELEEYSVASSGNRLLFTLYSSMSSFFLAQYGRSQAVVKKKDVKTVSKTVTGNKDCKFQEQGRCCNKRCVNYQYECVRPELCLKRTI